MAEEEEIDRAQLWKKAHEDKDGRIVDEKTSEVAQKIVSSYIEKFNI